MDRENGNSRKNIWEAKGRRGGLAESEKTSRKRSGSRYGRNRESFQTERSGSRYGRNTEGFQAERSGSRYGRNTESFQAERSGSRYGRNTEGFQAERSGSRYGRNTEGFQAERSGSRYGRNTEGFQAEQSGSRYGRDKENSEVALSKSRYGRDGENSEVALSKSRYERKRENTERSREAHAERGTQKSGRTVLERGSGSNREIAAASIGASGKNRQNRKRFTLGNDPVKIALFCLAVVIVIAYVVVAFYFGGHFYSGSSIYGIDCGRKTSGQVKQEVVDKIGDYQLIVEGRNGIRDTILASQINLQYQDESGIEQQLKKQRSYVWPAMLLLGKANDLVINTTYDRNNIDTVLKQMNCFLPGNVVAPQDAYRGDTADGYEVVPEVMGTTLDYGKTKAAILDALDKGLVSLSLEEAGCYIDPVIYQDDEALNKEVEELNSLLTARITYDFSDRQEVVDASVIKEWICKDEAGAYYIDDNHVWAYVEQLADKYDTFGRERTFYTSFGTAVTLNGGDYGWCMDQDATAEILAAAVKEGKTETLEPEYIYRGMSREENDIGGTYVEVCISRQEMWCYQDGYLIVDTPVVTGNPNKGNATPSGSVWAIDAKMRDYVLRGEGYASPVDYWMPFNGDIGIHDMQNRYYFGGSIYLTNGSHGCVNTPYQEAQTIYDIVSIGTPVVVYE